MERVHVCMRKEKTIKVGRVETASIRWEWQQLEVVETTVHPLANSMGSTLLRPQSRVNVVRGYKKIVIPAPAERWAGQRSESLW